MTTLSAIDKVQLPRTTERVPIDERDCVPQLGRARRVYHPDTFVPTNRPAPSNNGVDAALNLARAAYQAKYYTNATLALQKAQDQAETVDALLKVAEAAAAMTEIEFGPMAFQYHTLQKAIARADTADQLVRIAQSATIMKVIETTTDALKKAIELTDGTDGLLRLAHVGRSISDIPAPHLAYRRAITTATTVEQLLRVAQDSSTMGKDLENETRAALRQAILLAGDADAARRIATVAQAMGYPQEAQDARAKAGAN